MLKTFNCKMLTNSLCAAMACLLFLASGCGTGFKTITLSISTTTLPAGTVGVAYTATVAATAGTAPYSFSLASGTLPAGLTLATNGTLGGTPTAAGSFPITIAVADSTGLKATASYTLSIATAPATLTLGPATLPAATIAVPYTTSLQASGGTAPYTFTVTGGALPSGITLSTAGVLAGTATAAGTYTFTVAAVDSHSPVQGGSATFKLNVVTATVAVNTGTVLTTVPQTFFGMHTSVYDGSLNDTAHLPALLQTTGITTLRYPGGSYADRYHWAQASLTPLYASNPPICNQASSLVFEGTLAAGADFGSFVKTLQATGAQALITVNYGTSVANSTATLSPGSGSGGVPNHCSEPNTSGSPQEAAAWVAYANGSVLNTQSIGTDSVGFNWQTVAFWANLRAAAPLPTDDGYNFLRISHPLPIGVKYWEVGNEMYYNGWAGNRNFEADLHAPYIYPNGYGGTYLSRDSLAALSPTAYGTNAIPFIQAMKAVDPTIQIGVDFASPGATDPIPLNWNPDLAKAVCTGNALDLAIIHYYPGTYNGVMPSELLSLPQSDLPRVVAGIQANLAQYCPANASAIKFWLTETSPNGTLAANFPAPVTGLFALNDYLTSLQTGILNIDWLELHNGTYLDASENPGPAYYGIQLAHQLAGVGDSLVAANSSSPALLSFATLKTNGQKGVLLLNANPTVPAVVQVTVTGSTLGASATQYTYGISTTQSGATLPGTSFPIPGNTFNVTVPPYTALNLLIQ